MTKLQPYISDIAWLLGLGLVVAGVWLLQGLGWALIAAGVGIWLPVVAGLLRRA